MENQPPGEATHLGVSWISWDHISRWMKKCMLPICDTDHLLVIYPKDPDPSKLAILRTLYTPAIQVQTLSLQGPMILRVGIMFPLPCEFGGASKRVEFSPIQSSKFTETKHLEPSWPSLGRGSWVDTNRFSRRAGAKYFFPVFMVRNHKAGWWIQILFIFTPIWGNDPIWLIFFKGVETTN